MEKCVGEIGEWRNNNLPNIYLRIGDTTIQASESARNLVVIFENSLTMSNHIKIVYRTSFMQMGHLWSSKLLWYGTC